MSGQTLKLYDLGPAPGLSRYTQRVKILLKEKNIPFETIYNDPVHKPAEYVELFRSISANPKQSATVPTIIDGDVKLVESAIIAEYLDRKYNGPHVFPTDPTELALARLFVNHQDTLLEPAGWRIVKSTTLEENKAAISDFTEALKVMDSFLKLYGKKGPFFLGEEFSWAEAATLPFFFRIWNVLPEARNVDPDTIVADNKLDKLQEWIKAGFSQPSFAATKPDMKVFNSIVCPMMVKVVTNDLK